MSLVGLNVGTTDSLSAKTRRYAEYYLKGVSGDQLTEIVDNETTVIKTWMFSSMVDTGVLASNKNPLKSVYFGSVEVIHAHAFRYCVNLTDASFPMCKRIESISEANSASSTFFGCSSLARVYIPHIEYIGSSPFTNCGKLTEINMCKVSSVPTLKSSIMSSVPSSLKIVVPDELVEDFKAATNWSTYADLIIGVTEYDASTTS